MEQLVSEDNVSACQDLEGFDSHISAYVSDWEQSQFDVKFVCEVLWPKRCEEKH